MKLADYIKEIDGVNLTPDQDISDIEVTQGYVSDLLSDVMGAAQEGTIWITIMRHLNVIAVASLTGIPAVIFPKKIKPEAPVIEKAEQEGITLITTPLSTFEAAGVLYNLLKK